MKKIFKNLILAIILIAASTTVHAQWWTTGNTASPGDFLGTLNSVPLNFKVNNSKAGKIDFNNNIANTCLGFQTLNPGNPGIRNTAVGYQALKFNTGSANNAFGYRALYSNTTGYSNTANGFQSLLYNTTGNQNTANGYAALFNNTTASDNTATGFGALNLNTTGNQNTASGSKSLYSNTTGYQNTANGYYALYTNTIGYHNTANGYYSLSANTNGHDNAANGYQALFSNASGIANSAHGVAALYSNTIGSFNTANGYSALHNNVAGSYNTALGAGADVSSTTPNLNYVTAIGVATTINADNSTALGANAVVNAINGTNVTAIGANAVATAPNTMQLGATGTVVFANGGMVAIVSDKRFKDDIKESDAPGLDFINKLRPVSYKFNYKRYDDFLRRGLDSSAAKKDNAYQQFLIDKSKHREIGFIAQEVEKTVKDNSLTFNGVYAPQNSNDHYGLDYSKFVVPLVKAVQQLSKENDSLKAQLSAINARLDALENKAGFSAQSNSQITKNSNSYLYQIAPNPFSKKATISYKLLSYTSNAQLVITDAAGKTIKTYMLSTGSTQQDIYANDLTSGSYHYSLIVDGKIIDSKQMVITK